jgi:hypothetical protein
LFDQTYDNRHAKALFMGGGTLSVRIEIQKRPSTTKSVGKFGADLSEEGLMGGAVVKHTDKQGPMNEYLFELESVVGGDSSLVLFASFNSLGIARLP